MKIGIIGAGRIGQALALRLAPKGHEIMLSNSRGADAVREVAEARIAMLLQRVSRGADAMSPREALEVLYQLKQAVASTDL